MSPRRCHAGRTRTFVCAALIVVWTLLVLYRRLSYIIETPIAVKCQNTARKSLLHTYQIYARSPDAESRLQGEPRRALLLDYRTPSSGRAACGRVFVIVHSRASNFDNRVRLRRIFRNDDVSDFAPPIFVIATGGTNASLAHALQRERVQFDDLLELNGIVEHYHNISYKPRAWIDYLSHRIEKLNCQRAKFVVKLDDDIFVDIMGLSALLSRFSAQRRAVACRVFPQGQVTRNDASKWYLSKNEYSPATLGLYCQGMVYAFTADLLPKMRENIDRVQYLWMDDWYVTHALMNATRAVFFDVAPHVLSVESVGGVRDALAARRSAGGGAFAPIFAHFRPAHESAFSRIQTELGEEGGGERVVE